MSRDRSRGAHGTAAHVRRAMATALALLTTLFGWVAMDTATPAHADPPVPSTVANVAIGAKQVSAITTGADGNLWFANSGNDSIGRVTTAGVITTFTGTGISRPVGITAGPDGNLWFTNNTNNTIGRITTAGVVTNLGGTGIDQPFGITTGPDDNLWFTNAGTHPSVGRITTGGAVTIFTGTGISIPEPITRGPDGNLWFGNAGNNSIGRITTGGAVSNFTGTGIGGPVGLTAGPDGNLWFTNASNGSIGRITPAGAVSNFKTTGLVNPQRITAGPDGNLWFTNFGASSIGRITTAGVIAKFTDPSIGFPFGITVGPDSNLWFTNALSDTIGRISTGGAVANFAGNGINTPTGLVSGPDGNVWFTNFNRDSIGRITPAGVVSNFTDPEISRPEGITAGPDGNLWFTNFSADSIGKITPAGAIATFTGTGIDQPESITAGPDGNLWFTNAGNNTIGRITTAGVVSNFADASISLGGVLTTSASAIAAGPDGRLWFANAGNNSIGRITTAGAVSHFTAAGVDQPQAIATGPDGNLWFTNAGTAAIGRITPAGAISTFSDPAVAAGPGIAAGPDGSMWFTNGDSIGKITTFGVASPIGDVTTFSGDRVVGPAAIASGPGGKMWFSNTGDNAIGTALAGPAAPTAVIAAAGNTQAVVSWTAPTTTGGSPITGYKAYAYPSAKSCTTSGATSCTVSGLANGAGTVFVVEALNATGHGALSAPSNAIVPDAGTGPPSFFHPLAPVRIQDSRPGVLNVGDFSTPWGAGDTRNVQVTGVGGVPSNADAVVLNVTVADTTDSSFLTLWPAGGARPIVSSLNWTAGQTVPNEATVKVGAGGDISVFNSGGAVDVIIDVQGYYDTTPGGGFVSVPPVRIQDSRPSGPTVGPYATPWMTGNTRSVQVAGIAGVPADADAVVLNVTVTDTSDSGFLTIYPTGDPRPLVSSVNWPAGSTVANGVTAKIGAGGTISVFDSGGSADVIVDVSGYFKAGTGKAFHPINPARIEDPRPATQIGPFTTPWAAGTTRTIPVTNVASVPSGADAVVLNLTATDTTASSFLTVYPTGGAAPLVSSLNWTPGQTIANAVTARVGVGGNLSMFNPGGSVDVIVDIDGYYS